MSEFLGVESVVLDWFKFYLCDRYQCIKIGSVLSHAKRILYDGCADNWPVDNWPVTF